MSEDPECRTCGAIGELMVDGRCFDAYGCKRRTDGACSSDASPRCTVCGASRLVQDGRPGVCSLVPGRDGKGGCPDPLRDVRRETGEAPSDLMAAVGEVLKRWYGGGLAPGSSGALVKALEDLRDVRDAVRIRESASIRCPKCGRAGGVHAESCEYGPTGEMTSDQAVMDIAKAAIARLQTFQTEPARPSDAAPNEREAAGRSGNADAAPASNPRGTTSPMPNACEAEHTCTWALGCGMDSCVLTDPPKETPSSSDGVERVVAWLRGIPKDWREDWGLNATEEIADLLESGLWLFDGKPGP